ncbi:MAG: pyruvate formate-lyase [Clostridia bacterium]|nr:pyruvate formate-lyase [Clostridia bacterium]
MDKKLKEFIIGKGHRTLRRRVAAELARDFSARGLSPAERTCERFEFMCREERPVVFEAERIAFLRTVENLPPIFTDDEWAEIKSKHYVHELGFLSNLSPDYEAVLKKGLLALKEGADKYSVRCIDAVIALADRYAAEAERVGNQTVATTLKRIPRYGATSFLEALQLFRITHFALWLEGNYHVTVGAFDRYAYPYYQADIASGKLTKEEAYDLVEEFFLSFNRDSDLYVGVQQGDNGQSLVLGGVDAQGNDTFNELSEACLKASGELLLIDPKINIRVGKDTPLRVYELGTELTKKGLGFPQYTNDDIAIPALEKLGYTHEDACSYVAAACWELIIPKYGADVANIAALSFVKVIDECLHNDLRACETEEAFLSAVQKEIQRECDAIAEGIQSLWFVPSPFMNVCMAMPVDNGGKYNNFGVHGTGIASAADSLAAIAKYIYREKTLTKDALLQAVDENFENAPELLHLLRYETPKVGQNDDFVDGYLVFLLQAFSEALEGKTNCRGGKFRAGTGSAMYYLWHANEIGASPDGRRKGEPLGTNFSTSLFAKTGGPFSIVQSLTKPDFSSAMNGGPVTLEFSASMWQAEDAVHKFAKFIKAYIDMGGHQIQLNSVNLEKLKDAQRRPELYERLVVRIWGWSAYFTELDKEYQDHVMARQEYSV